MSQKSRILFYLALDKKILSAFRLALYSQIAHYMYFSYHVCYISKSRILIIFIKSM